MAQLRLFRRSEQSGMSLVEVLIGLAIASFLIAGVATVYANLKDIVALNEANREANALRTYIQGLMDQPSICSNALRTGSVFGGSMVSWNPNATPMAQIGHIEVNQAAAELYRATPGLVIARGQPYSKLLNVVGIGIREPNADEGAPSRSQVVRNGITYQTYAAKIQLDLQVRSLFQGTFLKRSVDVVVAIPPAGTISFCVHQENVEKPKSITCVAAAAAAAGLDCPASPPDVYCKNIYYYSGFDSKGAPVCNCVLSCSFDITRQGPRGPHGGAP